MLDIKYIRDNKDLVKENCKNRLVNLDSELESLLKLDEDRRTAQKLIESYRAERKSQSKGKPSEEDIVRLRKIGDEIAVKEKELGELDDQYEQLLFKVPHLTHQENP